MDPETPGTQSLGTWDLVLIILVQASGKYVIIEHLDP